MRAETLLDELDASIGAERRTGRLSLPGLSTEDIAALKVCGNNVAALAGETTDKEYRQLHKHRNVISYSILSSLHSCARRLVLEKISAANRPEDWEETHDNVDFVFGHSVGAGVQALFAFERLDYALYAAFLSWRGKWDLGREDYNTRKRKNIERACIAVESFSYFRAGVLDDWELFTTRTGKPAIELSFAVNLGKAVYFGHIDLVLRNRRTGRIAIGEIKTSGYANPDEASYRNSGQALGYSLVLDQIVGAEADYDVMYFTYSAPSEEWHFMPFAKTVAHKLEWVQDRLIDSGHLQQYMSMQHFPKNGANCLQFNRRCQFYGQCDLVSKEKIAELPMLAEDGSAYPVDYYFDVRELVNRQLEGVR